MPLRLPEDVRKMLEALAAEDDRPLTREVIHLIRSEYQRRHPETAPQPDQPSPPA